MESGMRAMAEPDVQLALAGIYERSVTASLDRIWENVFDWEHLAHLHESSFAKCELIERHDAGWRVALTPQGSAATQVIDLRTDRENGRYVSTTLAGAGTGSEIRVTLAPRAQHLTDVRVEFHLPEFDEARLASLGQAYIATYARLWDEDETMMRQREAALTRPAKSISGVSPLDLGSEAAVRQALPLSFDFDSVAFHVVELDGALVAHASVCPHWLGPLSKEHGQPGTVHCPWHGYRFDIRTRRCLSEPALRLARAPSITVVDGRVRAERGG